MKTWGWINWLSMVLAIGALVAGAGFYALGSLDFGVRLAVQGGYLVITDVLPYSPASMGYEMGWACRSYTDCMPPTPRMTNQVQPGMVVTNVNGIPLINLPQPVYGDAAPAPDPATGMAIPPQPIGVQPTQPEPAVDPATLALLAAGPIDSLNAVTPSELATWDAVTSQTRGAHQNWVWGIEPVMLLAGAVAFVVVAWWLGRRRGNETMRPLALPAALAVGGPIVLAPFETSLSLAGLAAYSVLMPLTLAPLAIALSLRVRWRAAAWVAGVCSALCAGGAVAIGLSRLSLALGAEQVLPISVIGTGMTALPGLAAAWRSGVGGHDADEADAAAEPPPAAETPSAVKGAPADARRRIVRGASYAAIGVTPLFAIQTGIGPFPAALPVWLIAVWVAGQLTVRPLTRLVNRAQLQRDLVVAATEAERARVAADIHDDALQELTMLVRRLDAAGDAEGADMARGISDRLRAICGDLRLPILDDLGIGPALDWLVLRIERLAGGEVRLERADGSRPPAEIELAFFRVAQEALSNAVKHGRPPIVVRYRSADGFASLSVDDAGSGITSDARDRAEADGHHFGLLNMAQRAEAIGAILDVRRWPAGGTHVGLEWRAR